MTQDNAFISLVADIGGTNTRLAYAYDTRVDTASVQKFKNVSFSSLNDVLAHYIAMQPLDVPIDACCVAIAGPVHNGKGTLTNLDWTINEETLKRATGCHTAAVLNDLQAQGYALSELEHKAITPIMPNTAPPQNGVKLVVGVGTGFNAVVTSQIGAQITVSTSEAGHSDLPLKTENDLRLAKAVATLHGSCAVEDILSGRGLTHIYAHLKGGSLDTITMNASDIMNAHKAGTDPIATQAVHMFCHYLGAICGNLALIHLPYGGIYLVGGVSRAVAPYLKDAAFQAAMADKGRFSEFARQFQVFLIDDDFAALTGAAQALAALKTKS